jgi:foldase protein PrsA
MARFSRLAALLAAMVLAAGCGGGGSNAASGAIPKGAVAVVGKRAISKHTLDQQITQKLRADKIAKQKDPKPGTPEYQTQVVQPVLRSLVLGAELRNIAAQLGVKASPDEVSKRLKQSIDQYYGGNEQRFQSDLKKYKVSEKQVRDQFELVVLQDKIQQKLEAEAKVTDQDVRDYYDKHKSQYATKDSRQVRFVLVDTLKLAQQLRDQLEHGGSWQKIAKKYSNDPSSAQQGGRFTVQRGAVVPQFENAAFQLQKGDLSQPIKAPASYVGSACKKPCYFVIEPISAVSKGKQQPFDQVKDQIRQTLVQSKTQQHVQQRVQQLFKQQQRVTHYAKGYAPPKPPSTQGGGSSGGSSGG